jgi:hypothetical protein
MTLTFALAVKDKTGDKKSKRGDVICVRAYPWKGGTEERKRFLFVNVDFPSVTDTKAKTVFTIQELSNKAVRFFRDGDPAVGITMTSKRRFHFQQADIKKWADDFGFILDWDKLEDPLVEYQPFDGKIIIYDSTLRDKAESKKMSETDINALLIGVTSL